MALVFWLLLPRSLYDQGYKHDRLKTDDLALKLHVVGFTICLLGLNLGFLFTQFL